MHAKVFEKVNYVTHEWQPCGDLKVMTIILRQQS